MPAEEKLMEQVKMLLTERSKKAIEQARQAVLEEQIKHEPLREALRYFMEEIWFNAAHPALLSLACEAVGGDPEATTNISAALVVLTGAADIHDDIIDQSLTKDAKPTVYGKYGKDIAIIAGDVLWFKGMLMLNEACEPFGTEKKQAILELAKQAFFDIGNVEAKEASLRRNLALSAEEYLEIIAMKVTVAEAAAKIGAIIGNGTTVQINNLGEIGKTLATLMTIRDEFVDMFELDEVKNRFKNECLPLPILYAFQDADRKKEILSLLNSDDLTETGLKHMLELIVDAPQVCKLGRHMHASIEQAKLSLTGIKNSDVFGILLESTTEDLPS
ncbi:MAG: polyprenyl synthetase family protein [Chloroflexi bacterium]|nr:polyprenyl synthetase family protein [Chloroflexota bacterium]